MRSDLKMNKGKLVAQGSHASLGALLNLGNIDENGINISFDDNDALRYWLEDEFTKIVLKCDSQAELLKLYCLAKVTGLNAVLITDAGHTVFNGVPTHTCIGIGPALPEDIDKITGHLKLL